MKKSIGIIGGAGPMAGAILVEKIIKLCQKKYGCKKDSDFPLIILYSFPFSNMLKKNLLLKESKKIAKELKKSLLFLEKFTDITAIACNTLHLFLENFKPKKQFINLIEIAKKKLKNKNNLILCTSASKKNKIHKNLGNIFYPKNQKFIDNFINKTLKTDPSKKSCEKLKKFLLQEKQKNKMIDNIVLGCTEFSLLNERFCIKLKNVIDPMDILVEQICFYSFGK